ncbi:bifunctional MaoC family dehydratase N-terminal/OB-fold nucleic acid binding domain-containing protein [Streptomyces sp. NPDC005017]|uniref:bifunctional MaoC family dehydratase N-terminal/OB-fold nucleic acid binding domain-containing protein n=1 Tax=Streptomyces sp. NPDC005017 TaxID=3364706 RepID=UPI00368043CD
MSDGDLAARLKAFEGLPAVSEATGKDPVDAAMIRHWCEVLGDTHPAYTGPDAVAPPAMLQVWTMGGLSGHDRRTDAYQELLALLDEAGCTSVVATDCEQEYVRPLRVGDTVTFDTVVESVTGPKSTRLGTGWFVTTRTELRVAGLLAGVHRFRVLKYAPSRPVRDPRDPDRPRERRPRPVVGRDNAGYWEGVERRELLVQRCTDCRRPRFPWLPGCPDCGSAGWDTVRAAGNGTVFSYVVMHHPPFPAFTAPGPPGPYAVGLIELAEGVRIVANVVGVSYDKVRVGMPVRLEFLRCDEELTVPVFRAEESGG